MSSSHKHNRNESRALKDLGNIVEETEASMECDEGAQGIDNFGQLTAENSNFNNTTSGVCYGDR